MDHTKAGYYTNLSYAQTRATAFRVAEAGTGVFVRTVPTEWNPKGNILCRVAGGSVYFWDRDARAEVEVSLDLLNRLAGG